MPYHHIAHLDRFSDGVMVGLQIKKGDLIGYCGKTGTTSPHCHEEATRKKPKTWTGYVWGMTLEEMKSVYLDPMEYISENLPMKWNKFGYKFGDPIQNSDGRKGFHPGVDLNFGSGADDLGFEIRATTDGRIAYMGFDPNDGSWGNHLWWEQIFNLFEYENCLIQLTESGAQESGKYALVYDGQKHFFTPERAGLAALTVLAREMKFEALTKTAWEAIPRGLDF